jgi:hypothetical protein
MIRQVTNATQSHLAFGLDLLRALFEASVTIDDVRFSSSSGLSSDITPFPKSATYGHHGPAKPCSFARELRARRQTLEFDVSCAPDIRRMAGMRPRPASRWPRSSASLTSRTRIGRTMHQADRRGEIRRQRHWIAFEPQAVWIVGDVRRQLLAAQLAEIGASPLRPDKKRVRGCKRRQPAFKPLEEIAQRLAVAHSVTGNGLNDRERVAHPMRELADKSRSRCTAASRAVTLRVLSSTSRRPLKFCNAMRLSSLRLA